MTAPADPACKERKTLPRGNCFENHDRLTTKCASARSRMVSSSACQAVNRISMDGVRSCCFSFPANDRHMVGGPGVPNSGPVVGKRRIHRAPQRWPARASGERGRFGECNNYRFILPSSGTAYHRSDSSSARLPHLERQVPGHMKERLYILHL